ncbi:hypothetical protein GFS60_06408 (plasmid) [Rhodococcus sp. WAY2]|nr:hypothetical protein GFS60_06408 [Rhodococcus sp. WAY2]
MREALLITLSTTRQQEVFTRYDEHCNGKGSLYHCSAPSPARQQGRHPGPRGRHVADTDQSNRSEGICEPTPVRDGRDREVGQKRHDIKPDRGASKSG